jgi:hypothetical protein
MTLGSLLNCIFLLPLGRQAHVVHSYVEVEPLAFTMTQNRTEAHDTDEAAE